MNHWEKIEHEKYFDKDRKSGFPRGNRFFDGNEYSEYRMFEDMLLYQISIKEITIEDLKILFKEYSEQDFRIKKEYLSSPQVMKWEDIYEASKGIRHCEAMKNLLSFHIIKLGGDE